MFDVNLPKKFNGPDYQINEIRSGLEKLATAKMIRFAVTASLLLVAVLGVGGMYGCPQYNVWQKGLAGQAKLAEAEQSRQIAIEEAKAIKESAQFRADAEIIRARGVSEANKIISAGLGGPEGYLRYLWIDSLTEREGDTIYVPTEAGLPILEANRRR
jgi:hypothetical protein